MCRHSSFVSLVSFLCLFLLLCLRITPTLAFNLDYVTLEPAPKPTFLLNATYSVIDQFMGIYRTPGVDQLRKVHELDLLVSTLRPEVQGAYAAYKAESLLLKLGQDDRLAEVAEKAHYTIAHLNAMKDSRTIGINERKKRIELVFSEFSDFVTTAVTDEVGNVVDAIMRQMLRTILFTEKMSL